MNTTQGSRGWRACLLAGLMWAPAFGGQAPPVFPTIPRDCPATADALTQALSRWRLACAAQVRVRGDVLPLDVEGVQALALDADGAVRGFVARDQEGAAALLLDGAIADAGSEEGAIFWGTWTGGVVVSHDAAGGTTRRNFTAPIRYVGGISPNIFQREDMLRAGGRSTSAMPAAGIGDYQLLGGGPVLSARDSTAGPAGVDQDGNPIAPARVTQARLRVDFAARTATLQLGYALRGASASQQVMLRAVNRFSDRYEAEECAGVDPTHCPQVELRFYGRQGAYASVSFSVSTLTAMAEPARVAARLQNVRSNAIVALKRF